MRSLVFWVLMLCYAQADVFRVYTEQNPPFNYHEKSGVGGESTKLLKELFAKSGDTIENDTIHLVPWTRAYRDVIHQERSMLYSTVRTQEREHLFAWVGPIGKIRLGVVAKKKNKITLQTLRSGHPSRLGTIIDTGAEHLLLKKGFALNDLDRFNSVASQLNKLKNDRLDAVAFNIDAIFQTLKEIGCNSDEYEVVSMLQENDLYFAFNKQTDAKTIENLNQLLKNIPR
jgi:polar amino acid transport system substrate-binding protein